MTPPLKPPVSAVESSYIIIDAMAIVNKIQIEKSHNKISTVQDLATHFVKRVEAESAGFKHVLLVFARYDFPMSLKSLTRDQRTKGVQVHFKLITNTEIGKSKQRCSCHTPRQRSRSPRFMLKQLKLDSRHPPAPVTPLSMEKRLCQTWIL